MAAEETRIDDETVRKVAKLSRLKLNDADVHRYAGQLTAVLGYVAQLNEVNVEGVAPMAHPLELHNVLRQDKRGPALSLEQVLANAPAKDGAFFTVPKVLGEESGS